MSERILTISDAVRLGIVCEAAERKYPVARVLESGLVVFGTARSIGDRDGNFATRTMDVRDCFLRVTTKSGLETYWPIAELMNEVNTGEFVANYRSED
jgi:hypothetical protein